MVPEQRFFRFPQCCKVREKKRNLKIVETSKMIGKVETSTINRERRKAMIAVLAVGVTTNVSHINSQQTNTLKMTKKNSPHQLKLQKKKGKKSYDFFHEIDRINKVKKKDLKRCKFKIMTKARTIRMANKMNILKLYQIRKMFRTKLKKI